MRRTWGLVGIMVALLLSGCGSAARTLPAGFEPSGIAFWSENAGMMAGSAGCPHCQVIVATTTDGGKSWTVRLHIDAGSTQQLPFVTATLPGRGWVTFHNCTVAGASCPTEVFATSDRGKTWPGTGPQSFAFSFQGQDGWAIMPGTGFGATKSILFRGHVSASGASLDGTGVSTPCGSEMLASVAALGPKSAVLLCVGEPGVGMQAKDLYTTTDGGKTWSHILSVPFGARNLVHGLGANGYASGMNFLPDGHGWLWEARGWLLTTLDEGRNWSQVKVAQPDSVEARGVSFVSNDVGYVLLQNELHFSMEHVMTRDGGVTWHRVESWPIPRH